MSVDWRSIRSKIRSSNSTCRLRCIRTSARHIVLATSDHLLAFVTELMAQKLVVAPRIDPRHSRARATVDAIIVAAARILADHGYAGLTTNKVAQRAGVSVGSLYQYFPSKESILV